MAPPGAESSPLNAVINSQPPIIPAELSLQIVDIEVELIELRREAQRKQDTFESSKIAFNTILREQQKLADKVLDTKMDLFKLKSHKDNTSIAMSPQSKAKHQLVVGTLEAELEDVNEKAKQAEDNLEGASTFLKRTDFLNRSIKSRVHDRERRLHELCWQRIKIRKQKMDELNAAYDSLADMNDADFAYQEGLEKSFNKGVMLTIKQNGEESPYDSENEAFYT